MSLATNIQHSTCKINYEQKETKRILTNQKKDLLPNNI